MCVCVGVGVYVNTTVHNKQVSHVHVNESLL